MTAPDRFDPILPAHAIEQCLAAVIFSEPVPPKILSGLLDDHRTRMLAAGLSEGPKAQGLQFNAEAGTITPLADGGPVTFVTADRGTTITIAPNQVSVSTLRYTRWAHFESSISKFLLPAIVDFCKAVSVSATQLSYQDRFLWTGTWKNFDTAQLLNPNSGVFSVTASRAPQQWHSHAGWFEYPDQARRRVVNVNFDVASAITTNMLGQKPSVGIFTTIQESVVAVPPNAHPTWVDESDVVPKLRQHHLDLKALLASMIFPAMAKRIGL